MSCNMLGNALTAGIVSPETTDAGDLLELTLGAESNGGVEDGGEADDQRYEGLRVEGRALVRPDDGLARSVRRVVEGRPGEVADVEGDDGGLQQTRARLTLLHLRHNAHYAQGHADDEISADEELVKATASAAVVDVKENEAGDGEAKVE